MNAAIIGMCNEAMLLAKILKHAANCPGKEKDTLKLSGVLCKNPTQTTTMAIELNIKAYLSLHDVIKDADVLFVAQPDATLANFSAILKENCVRNKIFCHFSSKYDFDILSCGTTNTCYSLTFPYFTKQMLRNETYLNNVIVFEGGGKRHEEFSEIIRNTLEKAEFLDKFSRRLALISSKAMNNYMKSVISTSKSLRKFSGIYDEECFRAYALNMVAEACNNESSPAESEASELKKDMKVLSELNYSDTKEFVRNMELHLALNNNTNVEQKDEVLRILKYKPGRN